MQLDLFPTLAEMAVKNIFGPKPPRMSELFRKVVVFIFAVDQCYIDGRPDHYQAVFYCLLVSQIQSSARPHVLIWCRMGRFLHSPIKSGYKL